MDHPNRQGVSRSPMNDSLDLSPAAGPGGNAPVFTVSEIAAAVKRTVEETFGRVRIRRSEEHTSELQSH